MSSPRPPHMIVHPFFSSPTSSPPALLSSICASLPLLPLFQPPSSLCLSLPLSPLLFSEPTLASVGDNSSERECYNWIEEDVGSVRVPKNLGLLVLKVTISEGSLFPLPPAVFNFILHLLHFPHSPSYLSTLLIRLLLTHLCWASVCILFTSLSIPPVCTHECARPSMCVRSDKGEHRL